VIALDTNILARYLLGDDRAQLSAARRLLDDADQEYWVPVTVVLELSWVLRQSAAPREVVLEKMREVLSLRNVRAQLSEHVFQALRWALQGMDFADALHLALSGKAERLVTFDKEFIKQSRKIGASPLALAP
jgi:predicted nucleic-acid-binding protein